MIYYAIEFQSTTVGAANVFAYDPVQYADPEAEAEAKYHTLLAVAAKSGLPSHGCMIVDDSGNVKKKEFYIRGGGGE